MKFKIGSIIRITDVPTNRDFVPVGVCKIINSFEGSHYIVKFLNGSFKTSLDKRFEPLMQLVSYHDAKFAAEQKRKSEPF